MLHGINITFITLNNSITLCQAQVHKRCCSCRSTVNQR